MTKLKIYIDDTRTIGAGIIVGIDSVATYVSFYPVIVRIYVVLTETMCV